MMAQSRYTAKLLLTATALSLTLSACHHDTRPTPKYRSKPVAAKAKAPRPVPAASPSTSYRTANSGEANNVLMRALSLVGTPYSYGGNSPEGGFDCSGFVNYVYKDMLNLNLPRTSRQLAAYQGPQIPQANLNTGDLVFFGSSGSVSHVGIYVGDGRFVHAPSTGGTVRMDRLDGNYWRDHYSGSRRVLGP